MQIFYSTNKLKKSVESPLALKKAYGTRAKLVSMRIDELIAAPNLEAMRYITRANCHELIGKLKGKLAVDISGNHRIIFQPRHSPAPQKEDGGLNWSEVTEISIEAIGADYH